MRVEAPDIDVTATQRQIGALATQTVEQFVSLRTLQGSTNAAFSFGVRAARPSAGAEGDQFFATDRNALYVYTGTAWALMVGVGSGTNASRAALTVDTTDNGYAYFTTDQNKWWFVASGAWTDRFVTLDLTTSLKINGIKVLGAQGAAVADASGGATVDAEARTALNGLLAKLRTHGLIAT